MTDTTNLDHLESILERSVGITNAGQAERDRDLVKTGALLSIARSLEATRVPDTWEALESPSGATLGWFDPTVARAIAGALGAQETTPEAESDAPLPIEVGSIVVLTEALELAGDAAGAVESLTMGEVLDLGVSEGEPWALVAWLEDGVIEGEPAKVWVSALTALEQREGEPVEDAPVPAPVDLETAIMRGDDLEPEDDIEVTLDKITGEGHVLDAEPDEVDDIDADFDTVVEDAPAPAVDPLTALKGKGKGGKR